jgi:TIR domain-containing protein
MDYEYDVALSFAGEQRDEVQKIAECLRQAGVTVFYDDFEKHNLWGKDLYQHLSEVYQKKARYCIVFASREYADKVWTSHELRSAQARALQEKGKEYILPVRFDDTEIPGLLATVGYLDFQRERVAGICEAMIPKLGKGSQVVHTAAATRLTCDFSPRAYISVPELQRMEFPKLLDCDWGQDIALSVVPAGADTEAFYSSLRSQSNPLVVAYGFDVAIAKVRSASRRTAEGIGFWQIAFTPETTSFHSDMEMGAGDTTADQFAEIRARRILLNENPKMEDFGTQSTLETLNEAMRESLIQGIDSRLRVARSDFPKMYELLPDKRLFLEAAWIKAAADLKLSGAVERIDRLALSLEGSVLDVDFIGHRHKKYVNVDPYVVRIQGRQELQKVKG